MKYESRYVAFVDILGLSDLLRDAERSEAFARSVYRLIAALSRKGEVFFELTHVRSGKRVQAQFDAPFGSGDRMTSISDAIVMSFKDRETDNELAPDSRLVPLLRCLTCVFWLQRGLLTVGVKTRGGISVGRLFHTRDRVIGEALVKAHDLEHSVALFPRTVIDDSVLDLLMTESIPTKLPLFKNQIAHALRVDADGRHFVDYLGFDPVAGDFYLGDYIDDILQETESEIRSTTDARILQKLMWLREYVRTCREDLVNPVGRFAVNAGTTFSQRFPRTGDNLISYAASLDSES